MSINYQTVKNDIYSNGDLPQAQGKVKFGKDPIYGTKLKLCGNDPVVKHSIYSNGDLDL
jgi:hypothetical protein